MTQGMIRNTDSHLLSKVEVWKDPHASIILMHSLFLLFIIFFGNETPGSEVSDNQQYLNKKSKNFTNAISQLLRQVDIWNNRNRKEKKKRRTKRFVIISSYIVLNKDPHQKFASQEKNYNTF